VPTAELAYLVMPLAVQGRGKNLMRAGELSAASQRLIGLILVYPFLRGHGAAPSQLLSSAEDLLPRPDLSCALVCESDLQPAEGPQDPTVAEQLAICRRVGVEVIEIGEDQEAKMRALGASILAKSGDAPVAPDGHEITTARGVIHAAFSTAAELLDAKALPLTPRVSNSTNAHGVKSRQLEGGLLLAKAWAVLRLAMESEAWRPEWVYLLRRSVVDGVPLLQCARELDRDGTDEAARKWAERSRSSAMAAVGAALRRQSQEVQA